ncbi:MAG: ATP-binding protein [Planctomycetaceae bacterium]|jgi:predicted ATPase|nr:ATP-binding protein [Planctomycetaceae bacterium]
MLAFSSFIEMEPSRRLNVITGDNGLGKTFLLESAWRAKTGSWAEIPAYPPNIKNRSEISYRLSKNTKQNSPKNCIIKYDVQRGIWIGDKQTNSTMSGVVVYARVDGSYITYDSVIPTDVVEKQNRFLSFNDVLNGINGTIEGLIRDWVKWGMDTKKYPFEILVDVLREISPPDLGELRPGMPVRLPKEPREIPTIVHPCGEIPIIHVSAGVKRIVSLAYLIVWAWYEHKENAKLYNKNAENRMVILIDEIESHLHPKWQRTILPALLEIQQYLAEELEIQFFVSTHSPLVLASVETCFDEQTDRLFHLKQIKQNDPKHNQKIPKIELNKFFEIPKKFLK